MLEWTVLVLRTFYLKFEFFNYHVLICCIQREYLLCWISISNCLIWLKFSIKSNCQGNKKDYLKKLQHFHKIKTYFIWFSLWRLVNVYPLLMIYPHFCWILKCFVFHLTLFDKIQFHKTLDRFWIWNYCMHRTSASIVVNIDPFVLLLE